MQRTTELHRHEGVQTLFGEFGWKQQVELQVDANATIGVLHRRGFGNLRHVEVDELWLQQELHRKRLGVSAMKGDQQHGGLGH